MCQQPTDQFLEIETAGSLAAILQNLSIRLGLPLGEVIAEPSSPLVHAYVASGNPRWDRMLIRSDANHLEWSIGCGGEGISLLNGATTQLEDVVRAAHAWYMGVPVQQVREAAPFVNLSHRAIAAEQGPAQVVTEEWRWLLQESITGSQGPRYRSMLETAAAEPRLRQLYPWVSHGTLRFSKNTGHPFSFDVVCIDADRLPGCFVVLSKYMGDTIGETVTVEDAVALAARQVPADQGPAVSGPAR